MSKPYDHKEIENKWAVAWKNSGIYKTSDSGDKPKCYVLDMFPYPSGDGLHVGHPRGYIATDIYSRFKRMNGYSILHPMGWDAFGLPAENFALKNKIHPAEAVKKNVARFKDQLGKLGFNYDWDREINTTDPNYYKWTQWIFLQLWEKGLAYESNEPINWCPSCKTGLANEDLEDGLCERCGSVVEKKPIRQWVLKIRDYADRLIDDLDALNWSEHIKESQRNWIGRSEGSEIEFNLLSDGSKIKIFTTRADTLLGVTYLVLAPEHPQVELLKSQITNWIEVDEYIKTVASSTAIERTTEKKEKTGVELKGIKAINPANGDELPVWISDYVLANYGTGAVMAVPAHDKRDAEFAKKYNLPVKKIVESESEEITSYGTLVNSGQFNGLKSEEAKKKITEFAGGKITKTYKLQNWVFSRQRYWGEPIPLIHCEKCGVVAVPEKDLPVELPEVESYEPTGTGESPLAGIDAWVNVKCPKCEGAGKRETNTMPSWAGSSWYYLAFGANGISNFNFPISESQKTWQPVDLYVGGAEHATRHLIYARFWHKFLFDIGAVNTSEPFTRLVNLGVILAEDGRKMSKRWGNVINPDDIVERFGADSLRLYEMFMGPFDQAIAWNTDGLVGMYRFIERIWKLSIRVAEEAELSSAGKQILNKTIKKVGEDIEKFKFNTAISSMMILASELEKEEGISAENFRSFLSLLAPFIPHVAEELWSRVPLDQGGGSIHESRWPEYDEQFLKSTSNEISVQVDGKMRGRITASSDSTEKEVLSLAEITPTIGKWFVGRDISKVIYLPGKLLSIVTKDGLGLDSAVKK